MALHNDIPINSNYPIIINRHTLKIMEDITTSEIVITIVIYLIVTMVIFLKILKDISNLKK